MSMINLTLDPHDRIQLSITIERLINAFDDLEADPDLEPNGDWEPWLGWNDRGPSARFPDTVDDDRELDTVDDEDGADAEPSLGSSLQAPLDTQGDTGQNRFVRLDDCVRLVGGFQEHWAAGSCRDDRELDDEREPDPSGYGDEDAMLEDKGEASLGWTLEFNQNVALARPEGWAAMAIDGEVDIDGVPHDAESDGCNADIAMVKRAKRMARRWTAAL